MVGTKTVVILKLEGGMVQRVISNEDVDVYILDKDLCVDAEDAVRFAIEDQLPVETQLINSSNFMEILSKVAED